MNTVVVLIVALSTIAILLSRRKSPAFALTALVCYLSLHFAYSGLPLIFEQAPHLTPALSTDGGFAKLAGIAVLIVSLGISVPFWMKEGRNRGINIACFLCALLLAGGYASNLDQISYQKFWLQDGLSTLALFVFSAIFLALFSHIKREEAKNILIKAAWPAAIYVLSCDVLGFYEVVSGKAWAKFINYEGLGILRASSLFINPNWFGFWLVILAFIALFTYETNPKSKRVVEIIFAAIGAGLFISGSRGAAITLVLLYGLFYFLRKDGERRRVLPFAFWGAAGLTVPLAFSWFVQPQGAFLHTLADRWVSFPVELLSFLQFHLRTQIIPQQTKILSTPSPEFLVSVYGRFQGDLCDNGYIALFKDASWLAVSSILVWFSVWFFKLASNWKNKGDSGYAYAWVMFLFCVTWSFQIRSFQVFPMWLIGGMLFAGSLAVLRQNKEELSPRPRLLIVAPHFLPGDKAGGALRALLDIISKLKAHYETTVVAKDRDVGDAKPYGFLSNGCKIPPLPCTAFYVKKGFQPIRLSRLLMTEKYDALFLNSFFSPFSTFLPLLLRYAGIIPHVPVMIAPHGELAASALSQKPLKKRVYISLLNLLGLVRDAKWYATSLDEAADISSHLKPKTAPFVAEIGVPPVPPYPNDRPPKLAGQLRLVFLSRLCRIKNLHFALETLKECHGKISLDIFGPIEDTAYWNECQALIKDAPDNLAIRYCGPLPHDEVIERLQHYDAFLLPSLGESFGFVLFEAAAAGCLLIASDNTPWKTIRESGAGWTFPPSSRRHLQAAIEEAVAMDESAALKMSKAAYALAVFYAKKSRENPATLSAFQNILSLDTAGEEK
jgi:glycosyltransferase involved in cell wall biosynthesis